MVNYLVSILSYTGFILGSILLFFGALYVVSKAGVWMENKLNKNK